MSRRTPATRAGVLLLLLALVPASRGRAADAAPASILPDDAGAWSACADSLAGRNPAIVVGEKLTFSVRYGLVKAGSAIMEIVGLQMLKGRPAYHVVCRTFSNSVFDKIYPVHDQVETRMDAGNLCSLYFEKHLREGNYKADQAVLFDQKAGTATYQDGQHFKIPGCTFDVLSAFYRVRATPLVVGQKFNLDSHADRKTYPLQVSVLSREQVDTPAGRFSCLKVEPTIRSGAFFKNEGKLTIWLTDDERRMPVLMQSKIPVGSITVILTEFERPKAAKRQSTGAGGSSPAPANPPAGAGSTQH